ncbi:PQQ-binding-like beta-propeller repeat protein [Actinoplanes sp. NPDC051513]|uniref:outer membrane protein assembly factor BamB family protein n=1 Tax=Actinoplanes sp. NPDC051513 TaxID=3363908 RepID=UPI00379D4AAF
MPVDLEEIFTGLSRHADGIPLGTAERARQRGRQRSNHQAAMLSAAVAVILVVAGVAGALARAQRVDHPVTPGPSPHALPEAAPPIPVRGALRDARTVIAGGRAYTAWQDDDGTIEVNATDPRTGAVVWTQKGVDHGATLVNLAAVSPAVLLTANTDEGGPAQQLVTVLRPSDGATLWRVTVADDDVLVPHRRMLVRWSAATGRTDAYDWATGAKRWSRPGGSDPLVRTMGVRAAGDVTPYSFTGDWLVQVTRSGNAQVRDIGTGDLLRTVPAGTPRAEGTITAIDGRLFSEEGDASSGYRLRITDLSTSAGTSAVVFSEDAGHALGGFDLCGADRLCLLDQEAGGRTTLAAVDLATRRTLWRVDGPENGSGVSSLGGNILVSGDGTTVLYDTAGRSAFNIPDAQVEWLTDDKLLVLPMYAPGTVMTVATADRGVTRLGDVPLRVGACAHTPDRLVCQTATALRFWSLSG